MRSWKLGSAALVLGTSLAVACGSGSGNDNSNPGGEAGSSSEPEGGGPSDSGSAGKGASASGEAAGSGGAAGSSGEDASPGGQNAGGDLPFTPSNIPTGSPDGVGDLVLSEQDCVIDTDEGTISCIDDPTLFRFSEVEQADGPNLGVFSARSILIEQSAQVSVKGSRPLVLLAFDDIDIRGGLDASGYGNTANGGGFAQTPTGKGGGAGGGGAIRNYAAGGGGAYCGKGGKGGFEADDLPGSLGGKPFGSPELVPLFGGASGGGRQTGGEGGAGGGAIQLVAAVSVSIGTNGYVSVGGGGGKANGGGAGSGGSILIEAPTVTVNGTLAANGGGGAVFNGGSGGQAGQPSDTAALGSVDTAGIGSALDVIDGGDGTTSATGDLSGANSSGGGGGGAGRIRINTSSGEATLGSGSVLSPSANTACVTQGSL